MVDQQAISFQGRSAEELLPIRHRLLFTQNKDVIKPSDELSFSLSTHETLEEIDLSSTLEGTHVVKVQENFKGVPVYDAIVTVELDRNDGGLTGQVSGHVLNEIEEDLTDVTPTITETAAVKRLVDHFNASNYKSIKSQLFVYKPPEDRFASLVWRISFFFVDSGIPSRPSCFMDAHNGDIIQCHDYLERFKIKAVGGNEKIGKLMYGVDMPFINAARKKGKCIYKSDEVRVFDYGSDTDTTSAAVVTFDCDEGVSDPANGAFSPATDAFFFGRMTVKMFKQWANVAACSNSPLELDVHYNKENSHAFFDGSAFRFSDGDPDTTYPYVTAGIVAHEIAHCFTEDHSDFEYYHQPGAIDEAYSDLVGEAAKFFIFGYNDWKAGSDVLKEHDYARFLCDQSVDGFSITHVDQYTDETDVHFSSGIFNKVVCELTKSPEWNLKSVFKVFTHANRFYWHPTSDFTDAACGVMKAAYDLGHETTSVQNVFDKVGIETCDIQDYIRQIQPNTIIPRLKAGLGESLIFKIVFTENLLNKNIKILTSKGTGDVDIFLLSDPTLTESSIISSSSNIGNFEKLEIQNFNGFASKAYVFLKPRLFKFSDVELKLKVR